MIYMVVGCPGSGKSWVVNQLKDLFHVIEHDRFIGDGDSYAYVSEIIRSIEQEKPILIEAPFSMTQILNPLKIRGIEVTCVFIQEKAGVIESRYLKREGKPIPKGHITRQKTYLDRALESKSFMGTSEQVLNYLRNINI